MIDTFQFFGPSDTPALVEFRAEWRATEPAVQVGMGTGVPPTSPQAFLGEIARAESAIMFSAEEIGFEAGGRGSTSPAGYAQIGTERNGVFL